MAGVAGHTGAPPVTSEMPILTERSPVEAPTSRGEVDCLSERLRPSSQPAERRIQHRFSDRVNWGTEHNLVAEPAHLGHIMAPHPDSAVRKEARHIPSKCMKDLWRMRDRGSYPLRASAGERGFQTMDSACSGLLTAASDARFGHLGNTWSSFSRSESLGSTGFSRSQTLRSPTTSRSGLCMKDRMMSSSSSIGWIPGTEGAEWSTPGSFTNGQPWKHGIHQSAVTNYVHNQKMSGMENAMRLIL